MAPAMPSPPALKIGEHCRAAVFHALAFWQAASATGGHEPPKGFNLVKAMANSQLLRNITHWCAASQSALDATLDFYTPMKEVRAENLAPFMAMLSVAADVTGQPTWPQAGLQARMLDRNLSLAMDQACEDEPARQLAVAKLQCASMRLCAEMMDELRDLQDLEEQAANHFRVLPERELELLRCLQGVAVMTTRLMVFQKPSRMYAVQATLHRFVRDCLARQDGVVDPEPLATSLAEQMAEQMARLESRLATLEAGVADAKAAACGAEQIAEAADRALARAKKGPTAKAAMTAVDKLAERVAALEQGRRPEAPEAELAQVSTLARHMDEVDDALADVLARMRLMDRLVELTPPTTPEPRVPSPPASPRPPPPPPPPAPRATPDLAARLDRLEAAAERLSAQAHWLITQVHLHFCTRWNDVHAAWQAMHDGATPHVPMPVLKM